MSSIRWKEAIFHDGRSPISLEESIRRCGAFGGIHDFDFDDEVSEDFASGLASWTTDALATWDTSSSILSATGGGSAIWYEARHSTEVPPSFVASFDLISGPGAFVFHGKTDASTADGYCAWWNATSCGFARIASDKTDTILTQMPYAISGPARIQVAVKWRLDSTDEDRKWMLMSMYADGREFVCYADDIGGTDCDWANDYIGFAVTASDNLQVDNLTVSQLHRIVDYTSVDPGEGAGSGLSRAIGTSRVRLMCRYDGTLRAWEPGNRSEDWAIPASRPTRLTDRDDRAKVVTHIRTIGALHAVDRFDDSEGEIHGHRFVQADDPNLMSESEVYDEAGLQINDAKEQQKPAQLAMPLQPFIEPNDRVSYDSEDYRVTSAGQSLSKQQRGGMIGRTALWLRRYIAT